MNGSDTGPDTAATGRDLRARLLDGAPVAERRIDLAGVSTAMLEAGEGPPTVLIHGQGNFGPSFLPLFEPLASTHRIIAPDLPGLGASEMTDRDPDGPTVMAWLSELIDKTCDAPPALSECHWAARSQPATPSTTAIESLGSYSSTQAALAGGRRCVSCCRSSATAPGRASGQPAA